jgi:hypothetical protein
MGLPATEADLKAAGYSYYNRTQCRKCLAEIEFWTTPKGKLTPLDAGTLVSHFGTCPNAAEFRKPFSSKTDGYRK